MPDWGQQLYPYMHLAGRLLLGLLFVGAGLRYLLQLPTASTHVAARGLPAPKVLTALAGVGILVGGTLVLVGWSRFIGAGLLVLCYVPKAFLVHAFWKDQDPRTRASELSHFLKDLALAGAALLIAYYAGGEWPFSLGG